MSRASRAARHVLGGDGRDAAAVARDGVRGELDLQHDGGRRRGREAGSEALLRGSARAARFVAVPEREAHRGPHHHGVRAEVALPAGAEGDRRDPRAIAGARRPPRPVARTGAAPARSGRFARASAGPAGGAGAPTKDLSERTSTVSNSWSRDCEPSSASRRLRACRTRQFRDQRFVSEAVPLDLQPPHLDARELALLEAGSIDRDDAVDVVERRPCGLADPPSPAPPGRTRAARPAEAGGARRVPSRGSHLDAQVRRPRAASAAGRPVSNSWLDGNRQFLVVETRTAGWPRRADSPGTRLPPSDWVARGRRSPRPRPSQTDALAPSTTGFRASAIRSASASVRRAGTRDGHQEPVQPGRAPAGR